MPTLQIYDPAMCCRSGVCGPNIDPRLLQIGADLEALRQEGRVVQRFNLAQEPSAFVEQPAVRALLEQDGAAALPATVCDGSLVLAGRYPSREELRQWLDAAP